MHRKIISLQTNKTPYNEPIQTLLLLCSSCTTYSFPTPRLWQEKDENPDRQQFSLGVMASVDYLPFAVALDKGIYDSLGLDLRLEHFFSPVERDAALQGGVLDGTVTDYTSAACPLY